jgi:hypothetical protein
MKMLARMKNIFLASAATGTLFIGLGVSPAAAFVPEFTIAPDSITGLTGYAPFIASDISGTSNGLIQQTGLTTQFEQGYVRMTGMKDQGTDLFGGTTGLNGGGAPGTGTYGMYALFSATATGISCFTAGCTGSIGAGGFTFKLFADPGFSDTFSSGTTSASGGTAPAVTDLGTADVVIGIATSISGGVGFNAVGAPIFSAFSSFVLCDGTTNQGFLGSTLVNGGLATGCGTFDGRTYFTLPVPFFDINIASTTAGSTSNIGPLNPGSPGPPNLLLTGVVADLNFERVPEPATLGIFGLGLIAIGGFFRRRRVQA